MIEITNIDPNKRPPGASADSTAIENVAKVVIRVPAADSVTVLFDQRRSLEERIINEQSAS